MKIVITISIVFLLGGRMAAQWELVAPMDTTWQNLYVKFFGNCTGVVASLRYSDLQLMKTWDCGETWDTIYNGAYATDVHFVNEWVGYKCSLNQPILKTTDGGYNWFNPNENPEADFQFYKLFFSDENHGFGVFAGAGFIYGSTNNGGITWDYEVPSSVGGYGVFALDSCHVYASGGDYCCVQNDCVDGFNFLDYNIEPFNQNYYPKDLYFLNEQNGVVAGDWDYENFSTLGAYITLTNDGGNTWSVVVQHTQMNKYNNLEFADELTGYCGGSGAQSVPHSIIKTTDGGNSWGWQEAEINPTYIDNFGYPPFTVTCISCINADTCFATGLVGAIWRTFNGGGPVYELPVSVHEVQQAKITLYPNPSQTTITFEGIKTPIIECIVYDNTGRVVLAGNNLQSNILNVEKLKAGLYNVSVNVGEVVYQMRFVKE